MPVLYAILGICVVMGGAFGWLYRRSVRRVPTLPQYHVYLDLGPERYRHLDRLFSHDDFAFLERTEAGRSLLPLLRRERRRLLRGVLAELRREFEALLAVGSMLATSAAAQDGHFSVDLVRQTLTFYLVYTGLQLYSYWPAAGPGGYLPRPLLEQVRGLRQSTRQLMAALQPDDMEQLRVTLAGRP